MLADTIRKAVDVLQQQGQRITVRAVHALSGGSLRDVHRLLKVSAIWLSCSCPRI
jgi:hypothetical protein